MKNKLKTTISLALVAISAAASVHAQTVISGPNINSSTWSPAGSPYIVTANCTVPAGQTLTILPGTTVWMGSGTSLTGNGVISAVGTEVQPIVFEPPVSSQMWNTIIINNTVSTNRFVYCEFLNATNALDFRGASKNEITYCLFTNIANVAVFFRENSENTAAFCNFRNSPYGILMTVSDNFWTQTSRVQSCLFSECSSYAIFGEAIGQARTSWGANAKLNSSVENCRFVNVSRGCRYSISGQSAYGVWFGYGSSEVEIANNLFTGITNSAIWLVAGSYSSGSPALLINNTIANAGGGVATADPWDAKIQNNIFDNCTTAVTRSGSLSATVSYNDFYSNTANFSGYPVTYGQVILANRNGTPCDVLFNIFQDPLFTSASDLHLQAASPCIDAGEGSGANFDNYFPPSLGTVTNDIGAYGGPNAGQWIVPASTNSFTLGITRIPYVSVTVNPPEPGNYRLEYSSALLGTNTWIQITNLPLTTLPYTYTEPAVSPARYYRAVKL